MQDLTLTDIFFITILLGGIIAVGFVVRIRFFHHCRLAADAGLHLLRQKELPVFYSSYCLKQECKRRFFRRPSLPEIRLAALASESPADALPQVQQALRAEPQNFLLQLLCAELCRILNRRSDFQHIVEQIRLPFAVPSALKARFLHLCSLNELYQTDMYRASVHCSEALRLYQKNGFVWEEAECYMSLAQIYRISGLFDVAFTMLREAKKIWHELGISAKQAEIEAYFGLAEIGRENYTAAEEYLSTAVRICTECSLTQTEADIKNWLGLTAYLQNKDERAAEIFSDVACPNKKSAFSTTSNTAPKATVSAEARAFAAEMLARIRFRHGQRSEAAQSTDEALALYQKSHHRAGIFECLYLKAEILYASDDYEKSAEILTALIKEKTPAFTTFYPANAYTLLGLIHLRQNRLSAAYTLFKQAIDLENSKNRIKGAAIDYNNLAEIALRKGNTEEAATYLRQALSYAEMLEDEELKNYLKAKL